MVDRLEKALEKAREQRRQALGVDPPAPPPLAAEPPAAAENLAPPPPSRDRPAQSKTVQISPDALESNRVIARHTRDPNADIFRMLRTKVLQTMTRHNLRTIAITSPHYGDGKSTTAVNLAMSLALDVKQTVLLVDLDLRSPSIHRYLGIEPSVGLSDYLLREAPVSDCLVRTNVERFTFLPNSRVAENSSEMLGTPKMAALAQELKTRYPDRLVIYDMPPLLSQDDTIAFLPHVDGVLLVVRQGTTPSEDLKRCVRLLDGANFLGTILNGANRPIKTKTQKNV